MAYKPKMLPQPKGYLPKRVTEIEKYLAENGDEDSLEQVLLDLEARIAALENE